MYVYQLKIMDFSEKTQLLVSQREPPWWVLLFFCPTILEGDGDLTMIFLSVCERKLLLPNRYNSFIVVSSKMHNCRIYCKFFKVQSRLFSKNHQHLVHCSQDYCPHVLLYVNSLRSSGIGKNCGLQ